VDSTGLKLYGAGEWLVEKHGAKMRRSWRKLHIGVDIDTGQIVAAALTAKEIDDGAEVGPLARSGVGIRGLLHGRRGVRSGRRFRRSCYTPYRSDDH
jgi:hypothetical protein